ADEHHRPVTGPGAGGDVGADRPGPLVVPVHFAVPGGAVVRDGVKVLGHGSETRVSKRWVGSEGGSAVGPVGSGPGWTMADRGAVSQRNRSPIGRPASGPSLQAFSNAVRPVRTAPRSMAGSRASRRASSSSIRAHR